MNNLFLNIFSKFFAVTNYRYVNRFVAVKEPEVEGNNKPHNKSEKDALKILQRALDNMEKIVKKYPTVQKLDENIFIHVKDLDNLKIWVKVKDGKGVITSGWPKNIKPSFSLPLYSKNLENLIEVTKDGELSQQEIYRFIRVLFIPFLKGLYRGDYSKLPKDKSYMQLDNFIQVEVKNENNVEVEGFPGPARATVLNVDGQWLIFEGFHGDPDVRYTMSVKEALEFAYLLRVKLIKESSTKNFLELKPVIDKYNKLKGKVLTYERSWHTA
jgi:hypothetical protein